MILKVLVFLKSLWFHVYNGFPKSSQEDINYRYSICCSCEFFNNNECLQCGCNINDKKIFMNKLAWADQHCPINKWDIIKK